MWILFWQLLPDNSLVHSKLLAGWGSLRIMVIAENNELLSTRILIHFSCLFSLTFLKCYKDRIKESYWNKGPVMSWYFLFKALVSAWSSWRVAMYFTTGGMRYHLLSPEDREELVDGTRPRRKKHDYRIALFGGSQPQSCRYFNPKVTDFYSCFLMLSLKALNT